MLLSSSVVGCRRRRWWCFLFLFSCIQYKLISVCTDTCICAKSFTASHFHMRFKIHTAYAWSCDMLIAQLTTHFSATRWNHKCVDDDKNAANLHRWICRYIVWKIAKEKRWSIYAFRAKWNKNRKNSKSHLSFLFSIWNVSHFFLTTNFHFVITLFCGFWCVVAAILSRSIWEWTWHVVFTERNEKHASQKSYIFTLLKRMKQQQQQQPQHHATR